MDEILPQILDALTEAVLVIDANRRVLLANRAAGELFGPSIMGQDIVRAVRQPECLNCIEEVLVGQPASQTLINLALPVRAIYQVNVTGLNTANQEGPRAIVGFTDISHIHEAEQMRSNFVANVSHELRSPLTSLSGFIETLKGPARDDEAAHDRFLDVMEREAQRMSRLIDDLLSLSKVEINERVRPEGTSNIVSIIERVRAALSLKAEAGRHKIRLKNTEKIAPVPGDDDELTQVFQNLIENAIKYGDSETDVTVTLSRVENAAGINGPALSVEVRDQGPGIPPSHIPRLTERFYRVDNGRSRDKGGTGLGLAIVKHIVNRHRGRLQIESELGRGSTFTVFLPMH